MPSNLKAWAIRFFPALIVIYAAWWWQQLDLSLIALLKIILETWLPTLFADLQRLSTSPSGGWLLQTSIAPANDLARTLIFEVDSVFLRRAVTWFPAVLALTFASAPRTPRRWVAAFVVALIAAMLLTTICVAANLAIFVNGTPSLLDDNMLPQPYGSPTNAMPYPAWYFHAITFSFYLAIVAAPMAMPIILWAVVCRREIRALSKPVS